MYDIKYALFSLLTQSLKPDMIILWLAEEQFPNREDDISEEILDLKNYGLTIKWCEDLKAYKKLIPALKEFPDDIIITVDDDMYYYKDLLSDLYSSYLKYPDCIHTKRGFCFDSFDDVKNGLTVYPKAAGASSNVFLRGGYGVLYPPHSLYKDVSKADFFMKNVCCHDDIWYTFMAALNNTKIVSLSASDETKVVSAERLYGIGNEFTISVQGSNAAKEVESILKAYPEIQKYYEKNEQD